MQYNSPLNNGTPSTWRRPGVFPGTRQDSPHHGIYAHGSGKVTFRHPPLPVISLFKSGPRSRSSCGRGRHTRQLDLFNKLHQLDTDSFTTSTSQGTLLKQLPAHCASAEQHDTRFAMRLMVVLLGGCRVEALRSLSAKTPLSLSLNLLWGEARSIVRL